jgi:hypothetical protein
MNVSGQLHASGERAPGTHLLVVFVGPKTGLDAVPVWKLTRWSGLPLVSVLSDVP